jgi:hypothetical protein
MNATATPEGELAESRGSRTFALASSSGVPAFRLIPPSPLGTANSPTGHFTNIGPPLQPGGMASSLGIAGLSNGYNDSEGRNSGSKSFSSDSERDAYIQRLEVRFCKISIIFLNLNYIFSFLRIFLIFGK